MSKFKYIKSALKATALKDKTKLENDHFRFYVTAAELATLKEGRMVEVRLESRMGRRDPETVTLTLEGNALRELNGEAPRKRALPRKRTPFDYPLYD